MLNFIGAATISVLIDNELSTQQDMKRDLDLVPSDFKNCVARLLFLITMVADRVVSNLRHFLFDSRRSNLLSIQSTSRDALISNAEKISNN